MLCKIPLIPLKCADEGKEYRLSLIKTPFGDDLGCNATYVKIGSCVNCGGTQTPVIKDWVSCYGTCWSILKNVEI